MLVEPAHILVTGSTGNLGGKAVDALRAHNGVRLSRIGRNARGLPDVIGVDLEVYDRSWARHFAGAKVVLHLAADPKPVASWASVQALNIDLCMHVLRAAEEAGVERFVFASSNWILGGYRFSDERLSGATSPLPINPYGASKLFMERMGLAQSGRTGMAFLSLRIGYCQPGDNIPGPHMAFGLWGQEMWLSNEDWAQAVRKACLAPFEGAAIINIMSDNAGMRWDLEGARSAIGYEPLSRYAPRVSLSGHLKDRLAWLREMVFPQMSETPRFGSRW